MDVESALANGSSRIRPPRAIAACDAAVLQAEGIYFLREQVACSDRSEGAAQGVREYLQAELSGSSACGQCMSCSQSEPCVRAGNRWEARHGNDGARWAQEGMALVGRRFLVCFDVASSMVSVQCT